MRRPIVYMTGAFTAGLAAAHMLAWEWLSWAAVTALCLMLGSIIMITMPGRGQPECARKHQISSAILLLFVLVAAATYFSFRDGRPVELPPQTGNTHILEGYVLSAKAAADEMKRHKLIVQGKGGKVIVSIKGEVVNLQELTGTKVRIQGVADIPEGPVNPGLFDYSLYLKSIGVRVSMTAESSAVEEMEAPIRRFIHGIAVFKAHLWELLEATMDKEAAGILFGMLFGDKTYMGQEVYEDFQKNGTAHILSVSGIHVGIIYACMEKTMGRKRKRNITYDIVVIALLVLYAALSEFAPSVMRAAFMIGVYIASKQLLRPYDFTTCISFTALVLLLQNPFYIYNTGFILSYVAVLVLAVLLPAAQRCVDAGLKTDPYGLGHQKKSLREKLVEIFLPVCIIQIGMMPLTAYFFNYFSLAAFFINTPVIFLAGFLLPLGFLLMGFSFLMPVCPFLFHFAAFVTEYPIRLMIWINHLTAKEGAGFFNVPSPSLKWVLLYYAIIFFLTCETGQTIAMSQGRKRYACVSLIVLLAVILLLPQGKLGKADVVFIDVGQGDAIHIRTPNGKNILIDGGGSRIGERDVGKEILYPYFLKNGIGTIDLAIITHMHEDHYEGLASLANLMPVKKIALFAGYETRKEEIKKSFNSVDKSILYLKKGQTIQLNHDISIQVLHPDWQMDDSVTKDVLAEDENKNSLVLKIKYREIGILGTGDLIAEEEGKLLEAFTRPNEEEKKTDDILKSDILKIGHHGSKTSSSEAFLQAVSPGAAVIQVGRKNTFGHPSPEVTQRLEDLQIPIYRNDEQGAILLDIRKNGVWILDMKEKSWKRVQ